MIYRGMSISNVLSEGVKNNVIIHSENGIKIGEKLPLKAICGKVFDRLDQAKSVIDFVHDLMDGKRSRDEISISKTWRRGYRSIAIAGIKTTMSIADIRMLTGRFELAKLF